MADFEDIRSTTPAPLRVVKRPSTMSLAPSSSRKSSGGTGTDESILSEACNSIDAPLTVRKRGQHGLVASRRAPAFKRLLRPERSYVKLPAAAARQESRIQSNDASAVGLCYMHGAPDEQVSPEPRPQLDYEQNMNIDPVGSFGHRPCHHIRILPSPTMATDHPVMVNRIEPAVLVPLITITPEVQALEEISGSFWTAIEVSGQICQSAGAADSESLSDHWLNHKKDRDHLRFGCLLDVQVDVQPMRGARITKTLQEEPAPTSLDASSTILVLVQVNCSRVKSTQARNSSFSTTSDELIEDLEHHLGTSSLQYLHVSLKYRHPAFASLTAVNPSAAAMPHSTGISSLQTFLETKAVASIGLNSHWSQWSPRSRDPAPNPLFRIVATHWAPQRAADAVHQILNLAVADTASIQRDDTNSLEERRKDSSSTSRSGEMSNWSKQWRTKVDSWSEGLGVEDDTGHVQSAPKYSVPQRKTSLQKGITVQEPPQVWSPTGHSTPRTSLEPSNLGTPSSTSSVLKRSQDGSTPRLHGTSRMRTPCGYPGKNGSISKISSTLKENWTSRSRGSPVLNKPGHRGVLEEFGARPRTRKASTMRKSSGGSKILGRWTWPSWW